MTDIVTITPNPAVDISTTVDRIAPVFKIRGKSQRRDPGGGGIDVARVVGRLGGGVRAIYPVDGWNVPVPFAQDPAAPTQAYESVACPACGQLHLINRSNGKLLGDDRIMMRPPGRSALPEKSQIEDWTLFYREYFMEPSSLPSGKAIMENFIHRENLALYRKRLAETLNDAQRKVLLKLLAEEEAKEPGPKNEEVVARVETAQAKSDGCS